MFYQFKYRHSCSCAVVVVVLVTRRLRQLAMFEHLETLSGHSLQYHHSCILMIIGVCWSTFYSNYYTPRLCRSLVRSSCCGASKQLKVVEIPFSEREKGGREREGWRGEGESHTLSPQLVRMLYF